MTDMIYILSGKDNTFGGPWTRFVTWIFYKHPTKNNNNNNKNGVVVVFCSLSGA